MPNWYVSSLDMAPKVIASTKGEDLAYVGAFRTKEQWKRTAEDKYDPYTNWMRYDMFSKYHLPRRQPYRVVPKPFKMTSDPMSKMTFSSANWKVEESDDFPFESMYLSG